MGGEEGDCSLLWVSNCSSLLEIGKIFHYSLVLSVFFPWFMLSLSCYQSTNYFPSYFPYSYEEDEWKNCVLDVSHPSVWNHHTWSPAVFEMTSFNCWSRRTQVCRHFTWEFHFSSSVKGNAYREQFIPSSGTQSDVASEGKSPQPEAGQIKKHK